MAWVGWTADQLVVADELPWGLLAGLWTTDRDNLIASSMQRETQVPHLPREVLMNEQNLHDPIESSLSARLG